MRARFPGRIKSVQIVTRSSWTAGGTVDDTITSVRPECTMLLPFNPGNNRVYGSSSAGTLTEHIHFELYNSTTIRWTCSTAAASANTQCLYVIEFFEPFLAITTATTSRLIGVGTSGSPTQQTTNVTISPPSGYNLARYLCLPATLMPDYGGNTTYFYPLLVAADTVRFTWAYGSDVYRTMKARVYWF